MILSEVTAHIAEGPIVFGGDLNTVRKRPAVILLEDAGFDFAGCNLLNEPTVQRVLKGKVTRVGPHIDYIAARGLKPIHSGTSPAVVLGAWPSAPDGKIVGDHAPVTVLLRSP